jgi:hypothetical protein
LKVPFVKDAYRGKPPVNWFPAADDDTEVMLYGTPGLREFMDLNDTTPGTTAIWGGTVMGNYLYLVAQTSVTACTLFQIDWIGNATSLGSIAARGGPISIVNNGTQVMVTHAGRGYVYDTLPKLWVADTDYLVANIFVRPTTANGFYYKCTVAGTAGGSEPTWSTVVGATTTDNSVTWTTYAEAPIYTEITDPNFIGGQACAFQDGYGIVVQPDSRYWQVSSLYDFTTYDSNAQAAKEGGSDNIVTVMADHLNIWVFGERTTEIWYNSGSTPFPFSRLAGTFLEKGIAAPASLSKGDNSLFWLSNEGQMVRSVGYQAKIISTRQFDREISRYDRIDDAIGYFYTMAGHAFYDLTFPSADVTWSHDVATGLMHSKASYPNYGRHRGNCYVLYKNMQLVGDYANGKLYQFDMDCYTDDGHAIKASVESNEFYDNGKRLSFPDMQVTFDHGQKVPADTYYDADNTPHAMLSWSSDGARMFPTEVWEPMGQVGEYDKRTIFRQLGSSYKRTYRLTVSAPVCRNVLSVSFLK